MKKREELEKLYKETKDVEAGECPMTDGRPGTCGTCMYRRWASDDDIAAFCVLNKKK